MRGLLVAACSLAIFLASVHAQSPQQSTSRSTPPARAAAAPALGDVVRRMSQYVTAYGAQASMFVATERYTQRVGILRGASYPPLPRTLVSEFAIVKGGSGNDWVGYRDVVQVNDKVVVGRRDRLLALLSGATVEASQLKQIDDESARYNIGPISRNFNVPTTVLFFFLPGTIERFAFERKGDRTIDGVATWELEFKEIRRPTVIRTARGRDAACSGRVWVVPADGTVVRTFVELRNFADEAVAVTGAAASSQPATTQSQGSATGMIETSRLESLAQIEVTYRLDRRFGMWLPLKMSELYEGAMRIRDNPTPSQGRASGIAEYSNFRRFETSAKIVTPK